MRHIGLILAREMLLEWRQRTRIIGVFFFAMAVVLMVAFASPSEGALKDLAGGTLWVALLLASTRALDQSYQVELENGALWGMVRWPVDGLAIYYGKALANAIMLAMVGFATAPLLIGIYNAPLKGEIWLGAVTILLGSAAIAAPGTLFGLITNQARGSSVLLPLLLFPLVVPALIAAAKLSTYVMLGDPMGQSGSWLQLLIAFDVLHWSLSGLLFAHLLEDG
jgi:heme exporter protein B